MDNLISWVEIDKQALLKNIKQLKRLCYPSSFLAVVKANAYGHGLKEVVKLIDKEVNWYGVNSLDEALLIRSSTDGRKPILIMGYLPANLIEQAIRDGFRLVVFDVNLLKTIDQSAKNIKRKALIHLKLETGTNRLGIQESSISNLPKTLKNVRIEGIYSHFSTAEWGSGDKFMATQLDRFLRGSDQWENNHSFVPIKHIASSAAAIISPKTRLNLVRFGIALYGLWPSDQVKNETKINLLPVLSWKTRIASIKSLKRGETVGYFRSYKVTSNMQIAVLPVGYFDGFDRKLSNIGMVLVHGKRVKVLGKVCMNMIMVDVSSIKNLQVGDEVVLIGQQQDEYLSVDEVADKVGTINYEIVSRINPNLPRIVV